MMKFDYKIYLTGLFLFVILAGCDEKNVDADFVVSSNNPATALTIGWYAPVEILAELVGPNFKPRVVNDKNESAIMLYIVKSDDHKLDGLPLGPMEAAHLIVPVEGGDDFVAVKGIENKLICPLTIVEKSLPLGDKYKEFGYPIYSGQIDLDVRYTGEKYMVEAKVITVNGQIEVTAMFEEDGSESEINSAIFSGSPTANSCFYGDERMTRFNDGKGNLRTGGENIIQAMGLTNSPYFLKLDTDITWEFEFIKK